jgi:NADPH2:quinone reductase
MRAWLIDDFSGIEKVHQADLPDPKPNPGEIVLDLEFVGLNPADRYLAQGEYPAKPPLPHVLGRDGVGIVSQLGPGITQFRIGQRLLILRGDTGVSRWGTFAQRVTVAADSVAEIPTDWTIQQAAGASLVYLTAYQALTQWGDRLPSIVLITGASGGVGVAATQLAKAMGHNVVALSRDEKKRSRLIELGAQYAVDPTEKDWPAKLKKTLAPKRVDLAIDNIGGEELNKVLETIGHNGCISVVGRLAGPVPEFNTASLFFRRIKIGGVHVGDYSRPEAHSAWNAVVKLLDHINAKPIIDRVLPFDQLPQAFERLAAGPMGKVLLQIGKRSSE